MTTYTYDTSPDEEAGMDYDLAVINGARMSATPSLPIISKQELFAGRVQEKWLRPLSMQRVQAQFDPMVQAFVASDQPTRDKITASVQQLIAASQANVKGG